MKKIILLYILSISIHSFSQEKDLFSFYKTEKLAVQGYLQAGVNAVAETNLFWNLADVPTLDYNSDTQWLESYIKPGIGFVNNYKSSKFYGKLSAVASSTLGTDAFDEKNNGSVTLEEAHLGYYFKVSDKTSIDISFGSQEFKLGTGMLISNGGMSGFERGALKFGPRKAWEIAGLAKINIKNVNISSFYLQPNELPSNNTNNSLAGLDINLYKSATNYIGISYINVLNSDAPYPQAGPDGQGPPVITFGARENTNSINIYGKSYPFKQDLKNLFTAIDVAYQWNERINMNSWGGRLQVGYDIINMNWRPTLMFNYQIFSGDDPKTSKLERFDPLFFEGSPSAWSTGSKSSMVFINSNVKSFGMSFRVMPSQKDILTFRYAHIAAQQLNSPIQFGQAARVEFSDNIPTVVVGVSNQNLANDLFLEYNRIVNNNLFLNAGFSMSFAGEGINQIVGKTFIWTGGFVNIVANF